MTSTAINSTEALCATAKLSILYLGPNSGTSRHRASAFQRLGHNVANRSTTRSFEIPHLGGVLCAERTSEHLELYREDKDAVFWSSPEECAEKCLLLLRNDKLRLRVASNGRARCIENGTTNARVLANVIARAIQPALDSDGTIIREEIPTPRRYAQAL